MKPTRFLLLLPILASCSNQNVYDAIKNNRQLQCQRLSGSQYEECMREYDTSYSDYEKQRKEAGEKNSDEPAQ